MTRLGRQSAYILLAVLALTAAIGFEQGVVRGLAAVRADETAAPANSQREPVPTAQPLAASPAMDEATVRRIAKEEADAAVARSRPKKAEPKPADADDDASDDAATPAAPASVPPPVQPAPPTG